MAETIRVALAQINPKVGDLDGNFALIKTAIDQAKQQAARLVVLPELCVTGYPPEDLLLRADFLQQSADKVAAIGALSDEIAVIVGHPSGQPGQIYNALSVFDGGELLTEYHKRFLPNYNVFDEKRYFTPGTEAKTVSIDGVCFGLTVCEDIWEAAPVADSVDMGADVIVSINASPFHYDKAVEREEGVVRHQAKAYQVPMIYVNQIGGQDELVFDGASVVADCDGEIAARLPLFESHLAVVDFAKDGCWAPERAEVVPLATLHERVYKALVTGVRDYVNKNGFPGVVLGLSGGIDSALVAAIAVDALGKDRVEAVMMPYHYTSTMSLEDAEAEANALGIPYHVIPIAPMVEATMTQLAPMFEGLDEDTTEENVQARSRGQLLMAISNKRHLMVLTTGNKSEMAVGYATLYGDMVGGFAAIKDVPKTLVYELSEYRNTWQPENVIPQRVITRPPSAELKPGQEDQDTLPEYDELDAILKLFVEEDASPDSIIAAGYDADTVHRVVKMVVRNEYKRRQAAPGVRITPRAFGRDRRYPITSGFF